MSKDKRTLSFDPNERDLVTELLKRLEVVRKRPQTIQDQTASKTELLDALTIHPDDPKMHSTMHKKDFEERLRNAYRLLKESVAE